MLSFAFGQYFILCLFITSISLAKVAGHGRFPLAYQGAKGWLTLEHGQEGSDECSLSFDFSSFPSNSTEIQWSVMSGPFVYGEESCDDVLKRINGTVTSGTLKMTSLAPRRAWRGTVTLKGHSLATLQGRSVLLSQKGPNPKAVACANILSDDTLVFESRFYGPELAGTVYFFLGATTKVLKVYSRLINGNNLDLAVKWALKNKWWIPDVDSREPSWPSCRESGDNADTRYAPPTNIGSLQPETMQFLDVTVDSNSSQSLSKEVLESSVLVLTRQQRESWQRENVLGCSRIRRSDGWSGQAKMKNRGDEWLVSFAQDTLYHPLLAQFKRTSPSDPKPAFVGVQRDSNDDNSSTVFYRPSNSSARSAWKDAQARAMPSFSLHRTLSFYGDCRSRTSERLGLLSPDNSLPVESDEESAQASSSAYFTDAALESVENNILMKTIRVHWPDNEESCDTIAPNQERTIFAQATFYYPFAGTVTFAQPKSRPESITVITGNLQHLFDDKPSLNANWTIAIRTVEPTLDEMSCTSDRAMHDPVTMTTELCRKSNWTCPIGYLTSQLGAISIAGYASSDLHQFSLASRTLPLGGPFSVVGATLKVDASWVKGCANISYSPPPSTANNETCGVQMAGNGRPQNPYRGAAATFGDSGGVNGTVIMYQPNTANDALPGAPTTLCNDLRFMDSAGMTNLAFEVVDYNAKNDVQAACHNDSASLYNPMLLNITNKGYGTACQTSSSLCALGDLTHRLGAVQAQHCACTNFLPISGPFGVTGRLLRIRRSDTNQILACAPFKHWEVVSTEVYVPSNVSRQQIVDSIVEDFDVDANAVQISLSKEEKAASKFKGCVLYVISIFDPHGSSIIATVSQKSQTAWTDKWDADKCVAGDAAGLRLSVLSAAASAIFCIMISKTMVSVPIGVSQFVI